MITHLRRRITGVLTAFTGIVLAIVLLIGLWLNVQQVRGKGEFEHFVSANMVLDFIFFVDNKGNYDLASVFTEDEEGNLIEIPLEEDRGDIGSSFLTKIEKNAGMIIDISVEGKKIEFVSGWQPKTDKQKLIDKAIEITEKKSIIFMVSSGGGFWSSGQLEGSDDTSSSSVPNEEKLEFSTIGVYSISSETSDYNFITIKGDNGESYRASSIEYKINGTTYMVRMLQDLSAENRMIFLFCAGALLIFLLGIAVLLLINWQLAKMVIKPTADAIQQQADFVAAASHELRSPLAVIRSSLSAADIAPNIVEADKYRFNAEAEAERMSRLVEDLLLLAGGDAGSWKLQGENVDLDTLLIETKEQFAPLAKKKNLTLALQLPEELLGEVKGDKDRLRQILAVLLDNALQYAPEHTTIFLQAQRRKTCVEIEVVDQGEGICGEEKNRIFERFYRADKSRRDKGHFGLGLSVAKELAELHGGSLTVRDTEGGGATFTLSLPQKSAPKQGG